MSVEENKAILNRFFEEIFNKGDLAAADELVARDYVNHDPAPGETPGVEGLKQFAADMRTGFPDILFTIDDQIAEQDRVVTRYTINGTHKGEFAGIPATGKPVTIGLIDIHRVVDGRIQECWLKWDTLDFMQQLGVIPPMG